MFGRINLLTEGAQAEGLVTKAWFSDPGFNNRLGVQVRFKSPDGSTGECTDRMLWVSDVGLLPEGSVVPVRYDPGKPSRAAIDVPALKARHAPVKAKLDAEHEARLAAELDQLGTDQSEENAPSGGRPDRPIVGRVTFREVQSGETKTRTILAAAVVAPQERAADEISASSPIAKAVLGHAVGDRVMVSLLIGDPIEVEIIAIEEVGSRS